MYRPIQKKLEKRKIVVVGGGAGSFSVLSGLKKYDLDISSLITMMDSGGSTGRLRDQLGVLPPGDLRQALVALSSSSQIWRELFLYRFEKGDLKGHNFGNIFLSALEKITGDIEHSVHLASELLRTRGKVIPITTDNADLCVELEDGSTIIGEKNIDLEESNRARVQRVYLKPQAQVSKDAYDAIQNADFIVLGPGDLYTSIIPNLVVYGVVDAIRGSSAKIVYIVNLMTKVGQTDRFSALDHLNEIKKYVGNVGINYVLLNVGSPSIEALEWYKRFGVSIVSDDLHGIEELGSQVIREDLISNVTYVKKAVDTASRSLVRHDPDRLGEALMNIFEQ